MENPVASIIAYFWYKCNFAVKLVSKETCAEKLIKDFRDCSLLFFYIDVFNSFSTASFDV